MSITILEVLMNAEYNLNESTYFQKETGKNQLHNAIVLLEKGYSVHDDFNEVVGDGDVDDVPVKED